MRGVLEVRPGAVRPEDLAEFERVLEPVVTRIGHAPRLVRADGTAIELPEGIHDLLVSIIEHLKAGNRVTVIPMHAELTTVEAADLLNVSRPFLIKQLEAGALSHHMVGYPPPAPPRGCPRLPGPHGHPGRRSPRRRGRRGRGARALRAVAVSVDGRVRCIVEAMASTVRFLRR